MLGQRKTSLVIFLWKRRTSSVVFFHKNITKLVFLWPIMGQKDLQMLTLEINLFILFNYIRLYLLIIFYLLNINIIYEYNII